MSDNSTNGKLKMNNLRPNSFDLACKIADSLGFSLPSMSSTADIMTRDVKELTLDDTVRDFLAFMKKNRVRHVVVFDPPSENETEPFFVGIVSERDVLRLIHPYADKDISVSKQCKNLGKPLVQIVTRKPISVSPDTPIDELISIMTDNSIDMVPVFEDNKLVGIVTTTDILELIVTFSAAVRNLSEFLKKTPGNDSTVLDIVTSWINRTSGSIMPDELYSLNLEDTLERAIEMLKIRRIRHVIVRDKNNMLAGVVSDRDILRHLPYANISSYYKPKSSRKDLFCVEPDTLELHAPLANIMTWEPLYITADCTVADAAEKFFTERLSSLPILDNDNNLTGIITVTDLMQVLQKIFA